MIKTLVVSTAAAGFFAVIALAGPYATESQDGLAAFKDNSCVTCHSRDLNSSPLSNHYLEWHFSRHMQVGVSCDKCHGGDPSTDKKEKSHIGVSKSDEKDSRTNPLNLSETCSKCHEPVSTAFTTSAHFKKLKTSGLGPSCSTCHQHMASVVASSPPEAGALCSECHNAERKILPNRPDIPARAMTAMEALARADGIIVWADGLLGAAKERKVDVAAEETEMATVRAMVAEAKTAWHTFTLVGVREQADAAFTKGTAVKDRLMKKLGYG